MRLEKVENLMGVPEPTSSQAPELRVAYNEEADHMVVIVSQDAAEYRLHLEGHEIDNLRNCVKDAVRSEDVPYAE